MTQTSTTITVDSLPVANSIDAVQDRILIYTLSATDIQGISRNTYLGLSSQPVGLTDSQTLTNKILGITNTLTLKDTLFTLQDDGDNTKQLQFQLSGITTGTTRTLTIPDASDTIAGIAATQTLTNKTLTSPVITGGSVDNSTVTIDTLSGHTTSNSGTMYGVAVTLGVFSSNAVVVPNNLVASTGTSWAWQSWTPTYTNLTVGNGVHQSFYIQIGKTVIARLGFAFGSTSSMGSVPTFTLPLTSKSTYTNGENIGGMRYVANSTGYMGYTQWSTTTTATLVSLGASSADTSITSSVPNTWGTTGTIYGTIIYEAA